MAEAEGGALRQLLVFFGADTHEVEEGMAVVDKGLGGLVEKFHHVGAAIGAFFAFREVKEFFTGTIEQAARLDDLSKKLGIGTDDLQKFQFAAKLVGIDSESAAHSIGLLNRHIGDAIQNGGEAGQEFSRLHIKLKDADGQVRKTGDIIMDVADAFKEMKSQPERSAAAMKLFGRAGLALVPLLQQGKEALKDVYGEFEELGGLMSGEFIEQSKKADDEMIKLGVVMTGVRVRVVNAMLPPILNLTKRLMGLWKEVQHVIDKTRAVQHAFEFLKILAVVKGVQMLITAVKALATAETLADLASPFTLMLIAIGLAYLAYDELTTFMAGGKTVLDKALSPEQAHALRDALREIRDAWPQIQSAAGTFLDFVSTGLESAYDLLKAIGQAVAGLIEAFESIPNLGKGEHGQRALDDWKAAGQSFAQAFVGGPTSEDVGAGVVRSPQLRGSTSVESSAGASAKSTGSSVLQQVGDVKIDVHVNSNDKPESVGRAIGQGVKTELDKKLTNALNVGKRL